MQRLGGASLVFALLSSAILPTQLAAQTDKPESSQSPASPTSAAPASTTQDSTAQAAPANQATDGQSQPSAPAADPIASNAPRMSKQTRYEIIHDFETQIVYSRTAFPMGAKGLRLKDGAITPNGLELQQALALWGPAIRPGDPAHISFIQIKDNHIHLDLNGGAIRRKKWYEHVEVAGSGGAVPLSQGDSQPNPHGTYLELYFDKYVPEMTAQQLRDLLYPVLDFNAHSKEQAYLDTLAPKVKQAIQAHYVLVGMNTEMVLHARGKPPKKVRERDGDTYYEEWIYGEPPQDVDFVRIVSDEVVRVETMKVGGQKIVRVDKEVILDHPDKEAEAKKEQEEERPANAPSMRRPGEDPGNAPKPTDSQTPPPLMPPPDVPQPPGNPGPGDLIASGK
jgi:hypothetical protein